MAQPPEKATVDGNVGIAALHHLRADDSWFDIGLDDEKAVLAWREFGFTPLTAEPWHNGLPDMDSSPGIEPLVAATFMAGGFTAAEASEWSDALLGLVEPTSLARIAQEWRAAGFQPSEARDWGQEVSIETACLYAASGWTVWEALLHVEWLQTHGIRDGDPRWHLLDPEHAIAYARAGVSCDALPSYEAHRRAGNSLEDILGWNAHHERELDTWTRRRLSELSDRVDFSVGAHAQRAIVDEEITPTWHATSSWPSHVEPPQPPAWSITTGCRWDGSDVPDTYLGCPEDYSLDPYLDWADEHQRELAAWLETEALNGEDSETSASASVQWPPSAFLTHPGSVSLATLYTCEDHDLLRRDCDGCTSVPVSGLSLDAARWNFSVLVHIEVRRPDGDVLDWDERVDILSLTTDPRSVDYHELALR